MPGLDDVLNLKLLSHPVNWLIVWTVLIFGAVAFSFVHKSVAVVPTPDPQA